MSRPTGRGYVTESLTERLFSHHGRESDRELKALNGCSVHFRHHVRVGRMRKRSNHGGVESRRVEAFLIRPSIDSLATQCCLK